MRTARLLRIGGLLLLCVALLGATSVSAAPSAPSAPLPPGPWAPYMPALTIPGPLFAVATPAINDAWAVGAGGGVYHFNGQSWSAVTSTVTEDLESVYPLGANKALVVGSAGADSKPTVLTCTPAGCTQDTTVPAVGGLDSVWAVSSTDYWAAGGGGAGPGSEFGTILHFNGGAWSGNLATGTAAASVHLHNIQMLSATEGWAVGEEMAPGGAGTIFHYTGGTWQQVTPGVAFTGPLAGLWFISASEGWVVGGAPDSVNPVILHYAAGTWTRETVTGLTPPGTSLWYVNMRPDGSGFASGSNGQILYRDPAAGAWTSVYADARPPQAPFYGVWVAPGANVGWAAGGVPGANAGVLALFGTPIVLWLPITPRRYELESGSGRPAGVAGKKASVCTACTQAVQTFSRSHRRRPRSKPVVGLHPFRRPRWWLSSTPDDS